MVPIFLQWESEPPGCHGKWLRVEVGAVGNLAHGHFNHVSDPSESNSIFTTLQKALKPGKKKLCVSCKQTPMSGCIYRLWADREGVIRKFCLGTECEWSAMWLGIPGHHSEYEVIKSWLMKPLWPGKRKIYAGWPPLQMHRDYLLAGLAGAVHSASDVVLWFMQREIS